MSKSRKTTKKNNKSYTVYIIIALLLFIVFAGYKLMFPENVVNEAEVNTAIPGAIIEGKDMKIRKADISSKASFYAYEEAGTYMEIIAVKASDGTIRTALNTCQVCYDSGRGYYEQVGNTLVCQNCRNVFGVDDIEVVKGGCNPVPIVSDYKTEDSEFISISGDFLEANKSFFVKWKR